MLWGDKSDTITSKAPKKKANMIMYALFPVILLPV